MSQTFTCVVRVEKNGKLILAPPSTAKKKQHQMTLNQDAHGQVVATVLGLNSPYSFQAKEVVTVHGRFIEQGKLTVVLKDTMVMISAGAPNLLRSLMFALSPSTSASASVAAGGGGGGNGSKANKLNPADKENIAPPAKRQCVEVTKPVTIRSTCHGFSRLPEEIVNHLLSYICPIDKPARPNKTPSYGSTNGMSAVCRMWRTYRNAYRTGLSVSSKRDVPAEVLASVITASKNMKFLELSSVRCVNPSLVRQICMDKYTGLERLTVAECPLLTDASMKMLLLRCRNLRTLDLTGCNRLTDDLFTSLPTQCPKLVTLHLNQGPGLSNTGLSAVLSRCSSLLNLHAAGCPNINHRAFVTAAANGAQLKLAVLDLSRTNITDELSSILPLLTSLRSIRLDQCVNITDATVVPLAAHCVRLHTLTATGLNLTNLSVLAMAESLEQLQVLSLSGNRQIEDLSVSQLLLRCSKLTSIDLSYCRRLTSNAFLGNPMNCTGLRTVILKDCALVGKDALDALRMLGVNRLYLDPQ